MKIINALKTESKSGNLIQSIRIVVIDGDDDSVCGTRSPFTILKKSSQNEHRMIVFLS